MEKARDVLVLGAGPAGLAAAACAHSRGLSVQVLDPTPERGWPNTYGMWCDELPAEHAAWSHVWRQTLVQSNQGRHQLPRRYGLIDNRRLRASLLARIPGEALRRGRAVDLRWEGGRPEVLLASGEQLSAGVVVDAAGFGGALGAPRAQRAELAWQTALGIEAEADQLPWTPEQMLLMDLRSPGGPPARPASFLYAMPLPCGGVLLEETVLAARPAVAPDALATRLASRLAALGIRLRRVHRVERVRIPMNAPAPRASAGVVPFGAAAGLVHPATGYSVGRSLALAPALAEALSRGLSTDPTDAVQAGRAAVRPTAHVRSQQLARSGLCALLALSGPEFGTFMHAFFSMPMAHWSAFLSGHARPTAVLRAMVELGLHLPPGLAGRVAHAATVHGGQELMRSLMPGGSAHA